MEQPVFGEQRAEAGGRHAVDTVEKSNLLMMWFTPYHCPAMQLREDILGQVCNGPGRWQEAENWSRR